VTDNERRMAWIWTDLLAVSDVGPDDDFFECGGHSMLLIPLVDRIATDFGRQVSVMTLMEHPTLSAFVRVAIEGAPCS
jgi:aryl carrier-like protein